MDETQRSRTKAVRPSLLGESLLMWAERKKSSNSATLVGRLYRDVAVVEVLVGLHNHTAEYCSEEFDRNSMKCRMRMVRKSGCGWNRNRSSRRALGSLKTVAHSP